MENFFSSCAELNTCCNRRVNQRGVRKGSLDTANETGFYAYYNDTLALAVEKAEGDSWISSGERTSRRLDVTSGLTLLLYGRIRHSAGVPCAGVRHINESHKLYVITLAQVDGGRHSLAFTWANYWFKNKTVYFGDWVAAANTTLSGYYAAMSRAVDALAKKWQASDKQYKPQAYPQISQALREISRAVAGTDIDKPLGRGYALVTDIAPAVGAFIITATTSAIVGTIAAVNTYSRTGDAGRAVACGAWITFQGTLGV
jgi:hypothetical protein